MGASRGKWVPFNWGRRFPVMHDCYIPISGHEIPLETPVVRRGPVPAVYCHYLRRPHSEGAITPDPIMNRSGPNGAVFCRVPSPNRNVHFSPPRKP